MMVLGKAEIRDALLEVTFETFHRRGIAVLEFGDEIAPALSRLRIRRCEKHLLDQLLHRRLHQPGQLGQDVAHLVHLASLAVRVRPHPLDRLHQSGRPVHDDQQRIAHPPGDQVLQKTEPRIIRFSLAHIHVQQHRRAVFEERIGGEHAFLLIGPLPRGVILAIEAEATAFLGRGHYRRGDRARVGWRNGYEPKAVQTEAGLLKFAVPQLRGTAEPFRPELPERLASRTPDLEALVRGMYVRGLSTQDIGALYGETFGETRLSKSTVSRITQQLTQDFETWRRRDVSDLPVVYIFLDGQYHAARQGTDE